MSDFLFCMNVGEWYCKVLWNFHFVLKERDLKVDLSRKFKRLKKNLKKSQFGGDGQSWWYIRITASSVFRDFS